MINQELIGYIKRCLEQGMSKEEIRQALLKAGWQGSVVEEGFKGIEGERPQLVTQPFTGGVSASDVPSKKLGKKTIMLLIAGVAIIILIAGGGLYWWQKSGGLSGSDTSGSLDEQTVKDSEQSYEGEVYGSLDGYVAKSLEEYKKNNPTATTEEISKFSEEVKSTYAKYHDGISRVLAACSSSPEIITSSINIDIDLTALSDSDPIFDQLKDSKITPHPFVRGYAVYGDSLDGCAYKNAGDGKTWERITTKEEYIQLEVASTRAIVDVIACVDLNEEMVGESGFEGEDVGAVLPARDKPAVVYAGVRDGRCLYKSVDSGVNWRRVPVNTENMVPQNLSFENLVVDPENSDHLYAVGGMFTPPKDSGGWDINTFIESFDGGVNWQPVIIDGLQTVGFGLGSSGKVVYATTKFETWKKSGSGYIGVKTDYYLYQSQDGGKNWNKVYESLGTGTKDYQCSYANIAVDRKNSDIVYAVCNNLYKSLDAGKTWNVILQSDDSKKQYIPTNLVVTDDLIYGVNPASGIELFFRSADSGKTWVNKNIGFHIYQIAVSQSNGNMIFATDFDSNVYVSKNTGDNWSNIDLPMKLGTDDLISSISFHDVSKTLFIGTNKGLYVIPIQ